MARPHVASCNPMWPHVPCQKTIRMEKVLLNLLSVSTEKKWNSKTNYCVSRLSSAYDWAFRLSQNSLKTKYMQWLPQFDFSKKRHSCCCFLLSALQTDIISDLQKLIICSLIMIFNFIINHSFMLQVRNDFCINN